ncbi:Serine/threonine-protein kinase TAO1 [Manis javanica]|nr:Serine/threonine-protein kinase TAO1 [Manis javanica]
MEVTSSSRAIIFWSTPAPHQAVGVITTSEPGRKSDAGRRTYGHNTTGPGHRPPFRNGPTPGRGHHHNRRPGAGPDPGGDEPMDTTPPDWARPSSLPHGPTPGLGVITTGLGPDLTRTTNLWTQHHPTGPSSSVCTGPTPGRGYHHNSRPRAGQ